MPLHLSYHPRSTIIVPLPTLSVSHGNNAWNVYRPMLLAFPFCVFRYHLVLLSIFCLLIMSVLMYVVHVKYSENNATMGDGILHQLNPSLDLCHLCGTKRTKRVLRALSTLLCALCALGGRRCARLGKSDGCHVRCETRNAQYCDCVLRQWYCM